VSEWIVDGADSAEPVRGEFVFIQRWCGFSAYCPAAFSSTVNASVAVVAAALEMMQLGSANPVVTPFARAPQFEVACK
jgi:hypothetical protein